MSQTHKTLLEAPETSISLSYVSLWEITIKVSLGKLQLSGDIQDLITYVQETDITLIGIEVVDLVHLEGLPYHHRDPFDRLLVAQAKARSMTLLTEDKHIKSYKEDVVIL